MGKKVSSFQIILLAGFGAIGVGAVLIFALAVGGGSSSSVGPVVIWGTFDQTAMTTLLRKEADANTEFSQVSYVQKDPTTYESDLANALASGNGPDLFIMPQDEAIYDANKAYVIPYSSLSQSQFENTFVKGADTYLSANGVVAVPILVDPLVLYWNRDALGMAGISEPPEYWDQLPGMSQQLTQKNDDGSIAKSAIALGQYQNIDAAKDILSLLIMQAGGTITSTDPSGKIVASLAEGSAGSTAAESALSFYTEFANPSQNDYTWNGAEPNAQQAFASGELAMYIGYASEEALITATNPNLNAGVAPVPQVRNAANSIDEGTVYALAIARNSKNPTGALAIAELLAGASIDQDISDAIGLPSARLDVLHAATASSQSSVSGALGAAPSQDQVVDDAALSVQTWSDPDPSQTDPIFQAMIEDTESGAVQITDVIQRADQQIGQLLANGS